MVVLLEVNVDFHNYALIFIVPQVQYCSLFIGEVIRLDIFDILLDSLGNWFMQVEILTQEAGFKFSIDAQQVVHTST
jgi:hypothetical protein